MFGIDDRLDGYCKAARVPFTEDSLTISSWPLCHGIHLLDIQY